VSKDLALIAKERGIRYFMISFTDLFGSQRAKLVPASAISEMQKDGAGFAGFATWLDMTPAHPDMFAMPDAAAMVQLPWRREVAWVPADLVMEEKPVTQGPRCKAGPACQDRRRSRILSHRGRRRRHFRREGQRQQAMLRSAGADAAI